MDWDMDTSDKPWSFILFIFFSVFIYFEREIEHASREGQRERIPGRLHTVSIEPNAGLQLMNHEIMT